MKLSAFVFVAPLVGIPAILAKTEVRACDDQHTMCTCTSTSNSVAIAPQLRHAMTEHKPDFNANICAEWTMACSEIWSETWCVTAKPAKGRSLKWSDVTYALTLLDNDCELRAQDLI